MKTIINFFTVVFLLVPSIVVAQDLPDANFIVKQTQDRNDGEFLTQDITLELISRNGKSRTQVTKVYRKDYGDERKQAIFYTEPSNVAGTSFLVYDYHDADRDDDQWLYLPAMRKTRRISGANRGDYFLGTDLTYDDIKLGPKISDEDYTHRTVGMEDVDGHKCYVLESVPVDDKTAKELGYSKSKAWVDANLWIVRKGEFWDIGGNKLKTVAVQDIDMIDGIWTPRSFRVVNHKTDHKTNFYFEKMDYSSPVSDEIFTENSLIRGI